jgi:hypothetical protein
MVWLKDETALQQELGIVQDTQLQTDLGQQAHPLHIAGMQTQMLAASLLGARQLAVVEIEAGLKQQGRQPRQTLHGPVGLGRLGGSAPPAMQLDKRTPAVEAGGVEGGGASVRVHGPLLIPPPATDLAERLPSGRIDRRLILGGVLQTTSPCM